MAEARSRFAWGVASSMMALMVNLQRDPKKGKPLKPSDFNPHAAHSEKIVLRGDAMKDALKAAFCRKRK